MAVPALCIEYQGFKARDTFGPVGLGDWVFTLDDLKADRSALLRAAAKVWADLPAARQRTAHAVALGKAAAERNRELLRQAWESHVAGALSGSHADP